MFGAINIHEGEWDRKGGKEAGKEREWEEEIKGDRY